jgi:hypothetical protein
MEKCCGVFEDSITLTTTSPRRIVDHPLLCTKVRLYAEDYDIYVGRQGKQDFLMQPAEGWTQNLGLCLEWVDLSTLWVRARTANAILHILGTVQNGGGV